jgi:DNA-binding SARP family transcriptional activator
MTTLHIQLLGDFHLVYGDETVTDLHRTRLRSLLAYLLLHRTAPQSRQQLAFLFWPDTSEAQARTNLRRELYHLRHGLPAAERFLQIDARSVAWRADASFTLDVADFEQSLQQADCAEQASDLALLRTHLERAVQLYRGKLLPDCYDDWVLPQRERLAQRLGRTLERLILLLEDQREYAEAIRYAQALLRHDPLSETTYRRLMRLHARAGDRASALRVYHTCASILQRELDVEPNQETQDAYARIVNTDVPRVLRAQTAPPLRTGSSLVGRQPEWQELLSIWRQVVGGETHFVLIAGEAGIGKTRLAEELYDTVSQQHVIAAKTRSYAAEGALAYAPVIEWLRTEGFRSSLDRLDAVWLTEVARLLPELLVARSDLAPPAPLSERWQRQRLFEALARAVLVEGQPTLLLIDDLQWCDPPTHRPGARTAQQRTAGRDRVSGAECRPDRRTGHPGRRPRTRSSRSRPALSKNRRQSALRPRNHARR